ncbi:MAG: hypothetical protein J6L98_06055 [Bacteroidales bacterium]|nr:hypothetical protein [Bacteroidales bacterium]
MRRTNLFIILAAVLAFMSCGKNSMDFIPEGPEIPKEIVFNLDAKHPDTATRAVKTGWETGDVIFVFFSGASAPAYLEMKWTGSKWELTTKNSLTLSNGQTGTMTAVYLPFGSAETVSNSNGSYKFSKTYYSYYLTDQQSYTVEDSAVSGCFSMKIPEEYMQFFVDEPTAAEADVIELREPNMTPVGIASIGSDGTIATEALAHGAPLPGYVYDKEKKASGENVGYLFSGILESDARGTATDYHFTLVKKKGTSASERTWSYYSKAFSGKTFYRGEDEGRAVKLPVISNWNPMTGDIPLDINFDVDGRRVYWSMRNLGATEEYDSGDYYAWGETEPHYETLNPLVWKTGKEAGYTYANHSKVITNKYKDGGQTIALEDDAANVKLGGIWRMPTLAEVQALISSSNVTWTWETNFRYGGGPNDLAGPGYRVISKANTYNWIFLPASGAMEGTENINNYSWFKTDPVGIYWTATTFSSGHDYDFFIRQRDQGTTFNDDNYMGAMIRPVMN